VAASKLSSIDSCENDCGERSFSILLSGTETNVQSRAASSNVLAEMKWTKPSSLSSLYGVALMGWPTDIPFKNPSENSKEINKRLLESLRDGAIQFVRETSERQSPEEMEREAKRPKISNLIT
jgi:hypothetical protein